MPKEIIDVPVISDLTHAVGAPLSPVIRANGFVFVSGTPPIDLTTGSIVQGSIAEQTEASLDCLKYALETAGSSLEQVVKTTVFASNSGHFDMVNDVYARYFSADFPARTFVAVGSWALPFDIEIECIALA